MFVITTSGFPAELTWTVFLTADNADDRRWDRGNPFKSAQSAVLHPFYVADTRQGLEGETKEFWQPSLRAGLSERQQRNVVKWQNH